MPAWAGPALRAYLVAAGDQAVARARAVVAGHLSPFDAARSAPHREHLGWLRHQEEIASGLGRTDPFLDDALVSEIMALPPERLLLGGMRRGLFREAVRDLLPPSLVARSDKAAFEPAFLRFVTAIGGVEVLRPLATPVELSSLGIVEPAPFREAFEEFARAPLDASWGEVWPVLAVEAFLRHRGGRAW
jgi:hypothetical protein